MRRAAFLISPLVLLAVMFPVVTGRERLAFRDVSSFYTPLYAYVAERCQEEPFGFARVAHWNPLDHSGMPLAGETTTAVYYPIRVFVYSISNIRKFNPTPAILMGWYVIGHLVIASLTAFWCANRFGISPTGCVAVSLIYPFSGSVFFLATNPPFLVSASWLPLVLGAACAPASMRSSSILVTGLGWALMILGGDPMTMIHSVIIVAAWRLSVACLPFKTRSVLAEGLRLALAGLIAATLAAPQLGSSIAWSAQSARVAGEMGDQTYAFSVPPWRLLEVATPNLFGCPWPMNTRWDREVFCEGVRRAENALWTPTLYSGIPACLAILIGCARIRGDTRKMTLWLLIAAFSILAAMGAYGPMYLVKSITGLGVSSHGSVGGVYWFLHHFIPGYDAFRYPSKWLPLFALSVSMVTGHWISQIDCRNFNDPRRSNLPVMILVALVTLGTMIVVFLGLRIGDSLPDPVWGPLRTDLLETAVTFSVGSMVLWGGLSYWAFRKRSARGVVCVVLIDLVLAHHGLIPTIEASVENVTRRSSQSDTATVARPLRWLRMRQGEHRPAAWKTNSRSDRLVQVELSQQRWLEGRWHLIENRAIFNSLISIRSQREAELWRTLKSVSARLKGEKQNQAWRRWRDWLGVDGVIELRDLGDEASTLNQSDSIGQVNFVTDRSVNWRHHFQVQFIEEDWKSAIEDVAETPRWQRRRSTHVCVQNNDFRSTEDRVEWKQLASSQGDLTRTPVDLKVLAEGAQSASLIMINDEATIVSRRVMQDGYWTAHLTDLDSEDGHSKLVTVLPCDLMSQAVLVQPGHWQIEFTYSPWFHPPCVAMALVGWLFLAITMLARAPAATRRQVSNARPASPPE